MNFAPITQVNGGTIICVPYPGIKWAFSIQVKFGVSHCRIYIFQNSPSILWSDCTSILKNRHSVSWPSLGYGKPYVSRYLVSDIPTFSKRVHMECTILSLIGAKFGAKNYCID